MLYVIHIANLAAGEMNWILIHTLWSATKTCEMYPFISNGIVSFIFVEPQSPPVLSSKMKSNSITQKSASLNWRAKLIGMQNTTEPLVKNPTCL